ncbi:methyl-accepting chemotaxis protein [Neobacillus sp. D3-1R]|uniref:methyl-accepting chemotaxis protein n=1 Tax=Neobacillus sp. D3-1R TaxID=3445778 RepID=UPI003F9EC394
MKLKIGHKLISMMLIVLIVPNIIIGTVAYFISKDQMDRLGKTTLQNGVEMAIQLIDSTNKQVENGELSLEDAQERVKEYLIGKMNADGKRTISNPVDLGEYGYFVVYDKDGLEVAHPSIEGKNVWETKDVDGKLLVQEQIKVAKNGGGFVEYSWALPNDDKAIEKKISYNKIDPNWGWVISAGTYKMDFNKGANQVLLALVITLFLSVIIGGFLSYYFAKRMSKPITAITNHAAEVANGNLSVKVNTTDRSDEIGELVNSFSLMVVNLKALISKVNNSVHSITSTSQNLSAVAEETTASSEEIGKAISEISKGAVQQASDADDTFNATIELASQIQEMSDKTELMSAASKQVVASNQFGLTSVSTLKVKSNDTETSVSQTKEVMETLTEKVKEIELIIKTINSISEQTNLLALNASIEAARAGEHGKGFAVVASEVRKLAEETSLATDKVRQTLSGIMEVTDIANKEMDKTKLLAKEQLDAVVLTEESFNQIAGSVSGIQSIIEDVNENIQLLVTSKDNVSKAVESIAAVSEESAASTEQVTSSIEEQLNAIVVVSDSAQELNDLINDLKVEIEKFKLDS